MKVVRHFYEYEKSNHLIGQLQDGTQAVPMSNSTTKSLTNLTENHLAIIQRKQSQNTRKPGRKFGAISLLDSTQEVCMSP